MRGRLLSTRDAARHAAEGGPPIDGALWSNLAELGFLGIVLLGAHGGVEMSLAEEVIAAEALGRIVAPIPSTRSEEHTSELQSLMRISYAVFCLKKKKHKKKDT